MKTKEYLNIRKKRAYRQPYAGSMPDFLWESTSLRKTASLQETVQKYPIICIICFERCSRRIVSGLEKSMPVSSQIRCMRYFRVL